MFSWVDDGGRPSLLSKKQSPDKLLDFGLGLCRLTEYQIADWGPCGSGSKPVAQTPSPASRDATVCLKARVGPGRHVQFKRAAKLQGRS